MTTELVPREDHSVEQYRASLAMTPAQAQEQSNTIREMTKAVLRDGVDFGRIPGVNKPCLFKPGAEWLLKWFGLGHHFEIVETDRDEDGKKYGVTYRCSVTKAMPSGVVVTVATCDGYFGKDDRQGAPWNTIVKMAQKRALVGAALQATGASGLFTQDVEDAPPVGTRDGSDGSQVSRSSRSVTDRPTDRLSNEKQRGMVRARLRGWREGHIAPDQYPEGWAAAGLHKTPEEWTNTDIDVAVKLLESIDRAEAKTSPSQSAATPTASAPPGGDEQEAVSQSAAEPSTPPDSLPKPYFEAGLRELRTECVRRDLDSTGTKPEVVERLVQDDMLSGPFEAA